MAQDADRELMRACCVANDGALGRACRAVAAGADVGQLQAGHTPLYMAATLNSVRTCEMLIKKGAAVDQRTEDGAVALHATCLSNRLEVAQLLVARGADIAAAANDGSTPLHLACKAGNTELADLLLSVGADPSCAMGNGSTPLLLACSFGHLVRSLSLWYQLLLSQILLSRTQLRVLSSSTLLWPGSCLISDTMPFRLTLSTLFFC